MAEPGLQKLQARPVDSTKGIFTTPDPNVPTTSQPLPSGRPTPKKKKHKLSVSDKDRNNVYNISMDNNQGRINVHVGDNNMVKFGNSGSSNASETNSEETREDSIASSSGDTICSLYSGQCPASSPVEEENKAARTTSNTNKPNEEKGHINLTCTGISGDNLCSNYPLRILTLIIVIGCIAGVVALSNNYKYFLGLKDTPTPKKGELLNFPDKCESNVSNATVGEPICVTHTQKFTSNPSRIHVRQESSPYLGSHKSISVNVSSYPFVQEIEDVIIGYKSSGTNIEYGLAFKKATCENIGKYNMTIKYSDGNAKSLELKFTLEEPTLKHSVNRINDSIHVYCEMKNNCKTISLNLFVNDWDFSRVIPTINDCNNPDRKSSSKIIAEAIIPVSWFSGNQTISCVPFMTDLQLAANLTSIMSIPVCEGDKPKLKHSVNRINDSIHVYCEMKNNCKTISLNLFVNDGDFSRVIPTINDCSNPDKKSSSKIIAEAIIPVSWFSGNQTISCVPFMTDLQLAANLTSTMSIPVCEGDNCEPNCKDDPHSIAYFQDKHLCNIFYQCSNGDIFLQKCLNGTSWSHSKCTCVHFDNEICDTKTNKFFQPAMSFEKCAKS